MTGKYYVSECRECGKRSSSRYHCSNSTGPTLNPPSLIGKCPTSSDGKHKPKWIEVE